MLEERKNNYLCSLFYQEDRVGYAYADVSTGGFYLGELSGTGLHTQLTDELARIQPTEVLANDALFLQAGLVKGLSSAYFLQNYAGWAYEEKAAEARLLRHFAVASLEGFGCAKYRLGICAAGALLAYLEETQKNSLAHIKVLRPVSRAAGMVLDTATRRNLELTRPLHYGGNKKNTLLYLLDRTKTAMGGRMLRAWVEQPLQGVEAIQLRLDAVSELKAQLIERDALRGAMDGVYDIERLCSRIAYGTVNARDCVALKNTLCRLPALIGTANSFLALALKRIAQNLDPMEEIRALLERAIVDEPPLSVKEGGIIRNGYDGEVDKLRNASVNGKQWLMDMEAAEREATGIKNLRIGFNKVFGYYIEVTRSYQNMVPYRYERKQTLAGAERYVTPELKKMEGTILGAEDALVTLEYTLFTGVREQLLACIEQLQKNAELLAELDCYQSLSQVAAEYNYCKPEIAKDGRIEIHNGRHPVVERSIKDRFIPNDALLNSAEDRLIILTGPNMAGKSTFMRQIALIVLMAHIGSFVPAEEAHIAVTDRIFTRVGASDDLASGQSTFMVEMSEMANILNNCTDQSLLILDEIGRGTSTFDGLSIAWAVLEHIANANACGAKTLFATHYHELTELEGKLSGVKNYRVAVKEVGEDVLFLHRIMRGGADKSFGIQVARLAGLPEGVLKRAKVILKDLERADINRVRSKHADEEAQQQLSLLSDGRQDELTRELALLDVDALTPLAALNLVNELHQRAKLIKRGAKENA